MASANMGPLERPSLVTTTGPSDKVEAKATTYSIAPMGDKLSPITPRKPETLIIGFFIVLLPLAITFWSLS